jgi:hypothetical protein
MAFATSHAGRSSPGGTEAKVRNVSTTGRWIGWISTLDAERSALTLDEPLNS